MIAFVTMWCLAFASYLLFAGTISSAECATGAVVAACAAAWARLIRRQSSRGFFVTLNAIVPILRAIADIPGATARTAMVLFKVAAIGGSPGRSHSVDFDCGRRNDPQQRSRRALAVLLASLTPDRFVVDIDPKNRTALIHTIVRRDHVPDARWLR